MAAMPPWLLLSPNLRSSCFLRRLCVKLEVPLITGHA
jgi:hypothetical protein